MSDRKVQIDVASSKSGLGKILLKCTWGTDTDICEAVFFRYLDTDTFNKGWLKTYLRYK